MSDDPAPRFDTDPVALLLTAAEKALRRSEERYRNLCNAIGEGLCIIEMIFDAEGNPADFRFLEVNAAFEKQTGLREAEGKRMRDLAPENEAHWYKIFGRIALTGEPARFVNEARALGRWYDIRAYRVGDPELRQVAVILNDLTESMEMEQALRRNEVRYRSLFRNNMDAIFLTVPDGRVTAANPAACELLGMTEEEICQVGRQGIVAPDAGQAARLEERLRTGRIKLEQALIRRDGTRIICEISSVILPGPEQLSFVIAHDITERKRAEEGLLQSEKLAAVGRLAASIAHEINNPLESVTNLLYLARGSKDLGEIQSLLNTAERELRRVAAISSQTLRFHKQLTNPMPVTYDDLIDSVLSIHQGRLINSRVRVEQRKRATLPVLCFDGEIRQVINNIVGNAIDAMPPEGGRLLIRSHDATSWKTGRKGLALTIADNGSGISAPVMKKMFKAFFTTKGMGGTGLGLWVSQQIVARHQGMLRVRSSQKEGHRGTVFTLFLPFDALIRTMHLASEASIAEGS